jgi:hypothetical protein
MMESPWPQATSAVLHVRARAVLVFAYFDQGHLEEKHSSCPSCL